MVTEKEIQERYIAFMDKIALMCDKEASEMLKDCETSNLTTVLAATVWSSQIMRIHMLAEMGKQEVERVNKLS